MISRRKFLSFALKSAVATVTVPLWKNVLEVSVGWCRPRVRRSSFDEYERLLREILSPKIFEMMPERDPVYDLTKAFDKPTFKLKKPWVVQEKRT